MKEIIFILFVIVYSTSCGKNACPSSFQLIGDVRLSDDAISTIRYDDKAELVFVNSSSDTLTFSRVLRKDSLAEIKKRNIDCEDSDETSTGYFRSQVIEYVYRTPQADTIVFTYLTTFHAIIREVRRHSLEELVAADRLYISAKLSSCSSESLFETFPLESRTTGENKYVLRLGPFEQYGQRYFDTMHFPIIQNVFKFSWPEGLIYFAVCGEEYVLVND